MSYLLIETCSLFSGEVRARCPRMRVRGYDGVRPAPCFQVCVSNSAVRRAKRDVPPVLPGVRVAPGVKVPIHARTSWAQTDVSDPPELCPVVAGLPGTH